MRPPLPAILLLAFLVLASVPGGIAPGPVAPLERAFALEAVAFACPTQADGVCLGYGGAAPGPLLDVNEGDLVTLTLFNNVSRTVWALDASPATKARLGGAIVSFHVHGTSLSAAEDGVAAHPGTRLIESVAHPNGSFTYRMRAAFGGTWHYHDHVLGADGSEGIARGLYGALLVRPPLAQRPDRVLDLHLLDAGANGGQGLDADVAAGARFEVAVVGLGNWVWDVQLRDPSGALVHALTLGPGESESILVDGAKPGTYRWSATNVLGTVRGEVRAR